MRFKKVEDFKFVHVANAFLSQVSIRPTYDGKKIDWDVALDLLYPEVMNAEQSCYLICLEDELNPVYVGQYTGTFKDRWRLRKGKYIWHSKHDDSIKSSLEAGKKVMIWLSVDPYAELSDGRKVNINKEIEQIIIEAIQPKWNTTGKNKDPNIGVPVSDICSKYEKNLPEIVNSIYAKFEEQGLDIYIEKLTSKGEKNWEEVQNDKIATLSRYRHFLNYISSGVKPNDALEFVWKEFP